jgi:hypothetical protein
MLSTCDRISRGDFELGRASCFEEEPKLAAGMRRIALPRRHTALETARSTRGKVLDPIWGTIAEIAGLTDERAPRWCAGASSCQLRLTPKSKRLNARGAVQCNCNRQRRGDLPSFVASSDRRSAAMLTFNIVLARY